ncbi:MAG TPA: hypothetical protein VI029_14060 [Mycobacterium sp.]
MRPLREARGDYEIEVMRDDLVRVLFDSVAKDTEVMFGDAIRSARMDERSVGVEFDSGLSREFDVVVGADGQHSALRALAFGPEHDYARQLGAYLSIYTVDNLLGLRDRTVLYRPTQCDLLRRRFSGMGWETQRLLDALNGAYDYYFDGMAQVRLPRWSSGRIGLLGDAAYGPSPLSGEGTSPALIGGYLLAHHLDSASDVATAFGRWESGFRASVVQSQRLAALGVPMLVPGSRLGVAVRNQTMRAMPGLARLGRGFGGRIESASPSVGMPD